MNLKKRGLGRGLDALLAETANKENEQGAVIPLAEPVKHVGASKSEGVDVLNQSAMTIAIVKNLHRENLRLQEEAVALKDLLDGLEKTLKDD